VLIINGLRGGFKMLHATAHQHNIRARFREGARDPAGDASAAARDESDTLFKDSVCKD
jgi:hypothetical protein